MGEIYHCYQIMTYIVTPCRSIMHSHIAYRCALPDIGPIFQANSFWQDNGRLNIIRRPRQPENVLPPGSGFTNRTEITIPNHTKNWRRETKVCTIEISLEFEMQICRYASNSPIQFQGDITILTPNFAAPEHHEIWLWDLCPLRETRPRMAYIH